MRLTIRRIWKPGEIASAAYPPADYPAREPGIDQIRNRDDSQLQSVDSLACLLHYPLSAVEPPTLIYLHLPKCGGTTLNRLIEWEYPPHRIYSVDPSFFRWSYYRLLRKSPRRLDGLRVIKGHMPFGVHRLIGRPSTYITVLRDPVERVISEYYFALHYPLHPQHQRMQTLTLEQYATTTPHHNLQCKLLAGSPAQRDFLAGDCTEQTLEAAKANLAAHFSLAGLTERFDETLALFKVLFGWKLSHYASFNVGQQRQSRETVPESARQVIAERNRYDVAIYQHVLPLFDQALEEHRAAVAEALRDVSQARTVGRVSTAAFQAASTLRKAISRIQSAI